MPDMLPTPEAISLLEECFSDAMEKKQLHSVYTFSGKSSDIFEAKRARIQSQKKTTEGKRKELKVCGLNLALVCGFGSDGASVMNGKNNGVGARLQKVCSIMVRSHCINHRLAFACSDANDTKKYIQTIKVTLRQLWKWLEFPKRCSAFVKVCVSHQKIKLANANDDPAKQKMLSKSLAVKMQTACRTRWLSTGQSVSSICRVLLALMQTLRQFKEVCWHDASTECSSTPSQHP